MGELTTRLPRPKSGPGASAAAPVTVDLFAGAGGLGEGLSSAGLQISVAHELHPQAALTYAFNHPDARVLTGDIRDLTTQSIEAAVVASTGSSHVDVVVGGPPCQGFSTAGRKVSGDPRNSLFMEFARLVAFLSPRFFLLENVPGFKRMYGGRAYDGASRAFREMGYEVQDTELLAEQFGVPQRRRRFVMVGWLPGSLAQPFEWPVATHDPVREGQLSLIAAQPSVTVEEAIADLAFLRPGVESHAYESPATSEYQAARRSRGLSTFNHLATQHRPKAVRMFELISEGDTISSVPAEHRSRKRTMKRLSRIGVSNAVLALPDDMIHYEHHRILTVREMARLQSFDDSYVFFGKRTSGFMERRIDVPQYTQVGNAVPPLLARALGASIMNAFGLTTVDRRNHDVRLARHGLIRGSSGFKGYVLDPAARSSLVVWSNDGLPIDLPIDPDAPLAMSRATGPWGGRESQVVATGA